MDGRLEIEKVKLLPALFLQRHPDGDMYYRQSRTMLETPDPAAPDLEALFFSPENVDIVQKMVVLQVFKRSNKQFHMDAPPETTILHWMRYIFSIHALHLPFNVTQQIRQLNQMVCDLVVPRAIVQAQQYIGYLRDKFQERELLDLPVNASTRRGAKTVPSTFAPLARSMLE